MNINIIRIVCLLDRSGSMASVREQSITAFNKFVDNLKASPDGACSLKLIQFDDKYEVNYDVPLAKVPSLTTETFVPRGSTAYLDAMGKAITELGTELLHTPEIHRPGKVIFVTLTDGYENASHEFTQDQVAEMIKHQQDKYSWDFVFLGADHNAVNLAAKLNIPQGKVMYYHASVADPLANMQAFNSMANYVNTVRTRGISGQSTADVVFSEQERTAALGKEADQTVTTTTP